ncbi:LOW QUALITY PROTEIN: protein maelstrom homolog [Elgaria multicarinata webbii]|uniref:LOW QUALITY PROTEIN: protein maelstrom homolog n=1 Tax=Elgaria multicarinata webbii TaxID=159646 RepID=UPI002FCCCD76
MPNRKGARNAYYFFVLEKLPELKRRGLDVAGVTEAIPHCSDDWAMLSEEQKEKYVEKARRWKAKNQELAKKPPSQLAAPLPTQTQNRVPVSNLTGLHRKCDQVVLETSFYFLNIFSHGVLPHHCNQRFLPCEIGCVKFSLKDGIIANFHRFIDPGEVPRGFRFHCQAAGDATHRIPISGFELASANHSVTLCDLYTFIQPRWGTWPPVYCKSDDQFRINWCLKHMAREAGTVNHLELLNVEDLVVELYCQKLQKEPSKTWVCNTLDASMWDYSGNTRCQWHEENDVLFCALATCKKIAYCISNSLANMYEIQLTPSHLPLWEKVSQSTVNPKMIVLDAGRFQKPRAESKGNDMYLRSHNQDQGATPCTGEHPLGVKTMCETSTRYGRGIARFGKHLQADQQLEAYNAVPPLQNSSTCHDFHSLWEYKDVVFTLSCLTMRYP